MDIQSKIHELKHTKLVEAGDDGGDGWKRVEASTGGWKWVETGGEGWEPAETGVKPLQVQEFAREQDDVRRWVWHQARGGGGASLPYHETGFREMGHTITHSSMVCPVVLLPCTHMMLAEGDDDD